MFFFRFYFILILEEGENIYKIIFVLKEIRIEKGLTQAELGKLVGVSQSHVSAMELGILSPSLKTFENICNALKMHPHFLMIIIEK